MLKPFNSFFVRICIIIVLLLAQVAALFYIIWALSYSFAFAYSGFMLISLIIFVVILGKNESQNEKVPWLIIIMMLPVFGGLLYLFFGIKHMPKKHRRLLLELSAAHKKYILDNNDILDEINILDKKIHAQFSYIKTVGDMSAYKNSYAEFLALGEIMHEHLLEELSKAEHFIFLEYFIICEGVMWNSILDILICKVRSGVDVRVIYDDFGCLKTLPFKYNKKLESYGIKCEIFNPLTPILRTALHNRDHRKIVVIDGYIGFTGGVNLADEYINVTHNLGHWKDCGVLIRGDAVIGFTKLFLLTWNFLRKTDDDFRNFVPSKYQKNLIPSDGYFQPYGDAPLDNEYLSEGVYLNIISNATSYLHITTPYFIVDKCIISALCLASKKGVRITIITPCIPDKWYVHIITRSFYAELIAAGINVYEYAPGFIHSKTFLADDEIAVVGTINLDYRSLYHHYECGVLMYKSSICSQMKADFEKTLEVSTRITADACKRKSLLNRVLASFIKIFAPLM